MFRNFRVVPFIIFGRGCFNQLNEILDEQRKKSDLFMTFLLDEVFEGSSLEKRIPMHDNDLLLLVNVDDEPKTRYVDSLTERVRAHQQSSADKEPGGIIGIGGGSTMDLAKAVSIMLTNAGSSSDYQGWDLVKKPSLYSVGIPTLSGTGAEVSRTTVLTGPEKKLGINSDYTPFDQIVLDPELTANAPREQRFYTGMDCYIHCIESLTGSYLNTFSQAYGEKALELCRKVFIEKEPDSDDNLMIASYFGGMSIAYSQVGVCHALSYGLSFVLGIHHGVGNCIAFDYLEEFYPDGVHEFQQMLKEHNITLPRGITTGIDMHRLEKMVDVALVLEPLWENALGKDWKQIMTRKRIKSLYEKM